MDLVVGWGGVVLDTGTCADPGCRPEARFLQALKHVCSLRLPKRVSKPNPGFPGRNYNFSCNLWREAGTVFWHSPASRPPPVRGPPRLPGCAALPSPLKRRLRGKRSFSGASGRFELKWRSKTGARLVPRGPGQRPSHLRTKSIDKANQPPAAKSKPRFLCVNAEL